MKFTFNRGTWEDSNPLPEWKDNEDFNDYLKRIGFNASKTEFGHEYGGQIEIRVLRWQYLLCKRVPFW
jgi:hypothetical protein